MSIAKSALIDETKNMKDALNKYNEAKNKDNMKEVLKTFIIFSKELSHSIVRIFHGKRNNDVRLME